MNREWIDAWSEFCSQLQKNVCERCVLEPETCLGGKQLERPLYRFSICMGMETYDPMCRPVFWTPRGDTIQDRLPNDEGAAHIEDRIRSALRVAAT